MSAETDVRASALGAVSEAVLAVTSQRSVDAILRTIVEVSARLVDARYAALGVPDDEGSFAQFLTVGISDEQWRAIGPVPRQHGLLGLLLRRTTPYRVADVRRDPRFEGWPSAHPTLRTLLGVPILAGGEVLGAIWLANKRGGEFTSADEELIVLLAAHAGIALTNARLYERSRELTVVAERTRIARELHDAVAQKLFGVRLTADAAATLVRRDPARAVEELARLRSLAGEAMAELRSVIFELRPAELEDDGLVATLRKHVEVLDRVHAAQVTFDGDRVALPGDVEDAVFRVAQEALHNALRHAAPARVQVALTSADGVVRLEVTDDGQGFDVEEQRRHSRRLGLASMADRAEAVGGTLSVTSSTSLPGRGTSVLLEVPGG